MDIVEFHVIRDGVLLGSSTNFLRATVLAQRTGGDLWQSRKVPRLLPATQAKRVTPTKPRAKKATKTR